MVSVGLNPLDVQKLALPITNRFGMSQVCPYLFTTDSVGLLPMRTPPWWCEPGAPGLNPDGQTWVAPMARPISVILAVMNSSRLVSLGRRQSYVMRGAGSPQASRTSGSRSIVWLG